MAIVVDTDRGEVERRAPPAPRGRLPRRRLSGGAALAHFAIAGLVAMLLLALVGMAGLRRAASEEAVRQATELALREVDWIVQPAVTDALGRGEPAAVATFDALVRDRLHTMRTVRLKLWSSDGTILYSDDARLIGRHFPLAEDDAAVLRTGKPEASLSRLTADENTLEPSKDKMLQVYARVMTPGGRPLLYETYLRDDSVFTNTRRIAMALAPAFLLALVLLEMTQLPLAALLVHRLRGGQRAQETLRRKVVEASDHERRRIARDLHDGVVQALTGASYSLASIRDQVRASATDSVATRLETASSAVRQGVGDLRVLITEIYPPDLTDKGIGEALTLLLEPLARSGVAVVSTAPAGQTLPQEINEVLFRVAQEAIRNIHAHAAATLVSIDVVTSRRWVSMVIRDNGVGFDPGAAARDDRPHLGLRLLDDLAVEAGGRLLVETGRGTGTSLFLELPLR